MPTDPSTLTGLAYIQAQAQASKSQPTAEEPLTRVVSPDDMALLMATPLPPTLPAQAKAFNFKTAQYPAFSTPLVLAYWQGLPTLTLEGLENLPLAEALPYLKVRQLGWKPLGDLTPQDRAPYEAITSLVREHVGQLYMDKGIHGGLVKKLMGLGVPVTKEKTMTLAYAQTALADWKLAALTYCAKEGISNPIAHLAGSTDLKAMSDDDFMAALDML